MQFIERIIAEKGYERIGAIGLVLGPDDSHQGDLPSISSVVCLTLTIPQVPVSWLLAEG
jgi:hypothetical protein